MKGGRRGKERRMNEGERRRAQRWPGPRESSLCSQQGFGPKPGITNVAMAVVAGGRPGAGRVGRLLPLGQGLWK
jgi:hypothetical protein